MNIPHDQFCVLPWVSLETSPIGTVRPCCLADNELVDELGNKFNLATASFSEIQNSQDMQQLRQEFLIGKRPSTCRKCWNEESAGRTSKRMHTLDRLKHMILDEEWTPAARPLMFLDLKLGNICNLKCRICGSWSSSTFATEELQALPYEQRRNSFHYQMLRDGAWPRNSEHFWKELTNNIDNIQYLEFTGGEPFMIQEHFDLLRQLVKARVSGQIEIHYNTNGTQWPGQDIAELWSSFKHVEIAVSIDDLGARFEYQRSGAQWTQVLDNLEQFKRLRARQANISLQVCSTVNIFNVYYLEDLANWIDLHVFDFVYWNLMHDAPYFSIATLPVAVKYELTNRLSRAQVSTRHQQEFVNIIDFMNRGTSHDPSQMLVKIQELDHRRNQSLAQVAPEFAQLIGYRA
jgi:MoaA/NifB/PqqE/SkfB family radical SAM enzyme